jgi:uncharacterized protein (DUF58 family)
VRRRALPAVPDPFPDGFRAMLEQLLRHGNRIVGGRTEVARARRRALAASGTFAGHRNYVPGDDVRRLDWHAFARTGGLFVMLLEEDERRATTVLLDTSPSMLAGGPPRLLASLRLAAILGGLALVHLDGVHVRAGGEGRGLQGHGAVGELLTRLREHVVRDEDPRAAVQSLLRAGAPGKVHWISDFAEPRRFEVALQLLRRSGRRVKGWLPVVDEDLAAPAVGWTRVVDPETGDELVLAVDRALADALAHQLQILVRQQQQVFAKAGFELRRLRLPAESFELGDWLEVGWSYRR